MGCYVQCFNYRETRLLFCTNKLFEKHRRKSDILSKGVRITVTDLYDSLEYHSYAGIFDMFFCSSSAAWFLHGWSIECKWVKEAGMARRISGLALGFRWNSAQREKFNFYFSRDFF